MASTGCLSFSLHAQEETARFISDEAGLKTPVFPFSSSVIFLKYSLA